jgi:hypothetical protein
MSEVTKGRRLPPLITEQMTNEQERDVVVALTALACKHLNWIIGSDSSVDPSRLSTAEFDARATASVDAYKERALALIDCGLSDAFDIVQTLVENR